MRKKFFVTKVIRAAVLLALFMTAGVAGLAGAVENERTDAGGQWKYILKDGGAIITGQAGESPANLKLPNILDGHAVTGIGEWAFEHVNTIIRVVIPDGVIDIGEDAFAGCFSLHEVKIPDSVTGIGAWAFNGCANLGWVFIPDNVTSIGEGAFENCGLNIKGYDDWALLISESSNGYAEQYAKDNNLPYELVPDPSLENPWEAELDYGGQWFYAFLDDDDVAIVGYEEEPVGNLVIPDKLGGNPVTGIYEYVFADCYGITGVTIPDGVTTIGESAFTDCFSLSSVTIPASVTTIGKDAFRKNPELAKLHETHTLVMYVEKGSYAERYAIDNNIAYSLSQSYTPPLTPPPFTTPPPAPTPAPTPTLTPAQPYSQKVTLKNARSVNIRSGPGKQHPQIGEAYPGVSFYYTGKVENGFYQILYPTLDARNELGYITAYVMQNLATVSSVSPRDFMPLSPVGDVKLKPKAKVYLDAALSVGVNGAAINYNSMPFAGISSNGSYAILFYKTSDKGGKILWIGFVSPKDVLSVGYA